MMKKIITLIIFIFCVNGLYAYQKDSTRIQAKIVPEKLYKGGTGNLVVTLEIPQNQHISGIENGMLEVVPSVLAGVTFSKAEFPPSEKKSTGTVYRDRIEVRVPFKIESGILEGEKILTARVVYQPCDETGGVCYLPITRNLDARFTILSGEESHLLKPSPSSGVSSRLNQALEKGSLAAFFIVFLGGLLTSLTPCVYPMIPITIAVIGAQTTGRKGRGFVLSLFYVLGVAVTFSALGVIAAKTGALFGSITQNAVLIFIISIIFFLMGLSMLGVFSLQMPPSIAAKLRGKRRGGFLGAFTTGVVAGLVVSPCISPLLVVILTWVAKTGSVFLGFGLLFSFALGLGVLFILLGTFSGVIHNLPKSGGWTEYIERMFGLVLIVFSIYVLRSIVSQFLYHNIWALFFLFLGTFLGGFTSLEREAGLKKKIGKAFGFLFVFFSCSLIFFGLAQKFNFIPARVTANQSIQKSTVDWSFSDEDAFEKARLSNMPVIIDFYADWCTSCIEMENKTWSDPSVQSELEHFIRVKMDLTKTGVDEKSIQNKYKVVGMPTVILFDPSRKELYRFEGFKPADEILEILRINYRS